MREVTASNILKEYVDGKLDLVEVFGDTVLVDNETKQFLFSPEEVMEEVYYYLDIIAEYENQRWSGDTW